MKTGKFWLTKLSRADQKKFKENFANDRLKIEANENIDDWLNAKYSSRNNFIISSFVWDETPEGHEY